MVTGVTIQDILEEVPVTDRTIRYWVHKGLLPKPEKVGLGRAKGTTAYYPPETLTKAKAIYDIRQASRTSSLLRLIKTIGTNQILIGKDTDGFTTLVYRPKSFQEG